MKRWLLVMLTLSACSQPLSKGLVPPIGSPSSGKEEAMGVALGVADEHGVVLNDEAVAGKVVLVDFWASWCGPCQHSIPFYRRLFERFSRKGLVVVGVNVDDSKDNFIEYLSLHPLPFSLVWDKDKMLSTRFNVMQLPTSFLFDRKGRLRRTRYGFDPSESRSVEDEVMLLIGENH